MVLTKKAKAAKAREERKRGSAWWRSRAEVLQIPEGQVREGQGQRLHAQQGLGEAPETFTERILFMSMFNDISCDRKGNKEECLANARVVSILAKKFGIGQWSFIGPGSEKKWYSGEENSPEGAWDHIADEMPLEFAESGHPIFRATTPFSRGKLRSEGHGKLSIHYCAYQATVETIFRIIVSANQLSLYGAVAEMCEEYETLHDRSERLDVMGQSIVVSEIQTEVPLENDEPAYQNFVLQQYEERIERL